MDSNLLLLFLMGFYAPHRIARFSRTRSYSSGDFIVLLEFLDQFRRIVTTPHVLTEVSNLAGKLGPELLPGFYSVLKGFIENQFEVSIESRHIAQTGIFARLGLTDAAVGLLSKEQHLVLTDDAILVSYLGAIGVDVVDFNMVRAIMRAS